MPAAQGLRGFVEKGGRSVLLGWGCGFPQGAGSKGGGFSAEEDRPAAARRWTRPDEPAAAGNARTLGRRRYGGVGRTQEAGVVYRGSGAGSRLGRGAGMHTFAAARGGGEPETVMRPRKPGAKRQTRHRARLTKNRSARAAGRSVAVGKTRGTGPHKNRGGSVR